MEWGSGSRNSDPEDKLEIGPTGIKASSKRTDIVPLMTFVAVCLIAYGGFQHAEASKDDTKVLADAIKENTKVQREQLAAQRETNCLNRLTTDERKNPREIEFCKRLGQER